MTEEIIIDEPTIVRRKSGQDIGNPNPPSLIEVPHEGHKSDSDSWRRTKDRDYLKKRARQLINNGADDKDLFRIIAPRRG